ncbi:sensor histidine kinase [Paenibacillus lentus]|uniref:cache domain-containing sensor histidine kinase n=1 Tax=Paenibacillus lentus TaxID=1338368 RepID=UPI0036589106
MKSKLLLSWWNDLRLKNKLMILYFVAVFIPIALTNTIFYTMTANYVRTEKIKDLKLSLEGNKDNFRKTIDSIISFSTVIYTDGSLVGALDHTYGSEAEVLTAYSEVLNPSINRFVPMNKQFYNAYLYTDNTTLIHSGMLNFIDRETEQQDWYRATVAPSRSRKWMIYTHSQPDPSYISVIRELDFYKLYSTYRKILKIDILPEYLQNTLFDQTFPGKLYLLNPQGDIVYSSEENLPQRLSDTVQQDMTVIFSVFDGVDYLQGWQIAGVYPNSVIERSLLDSRKFIVYLTLANFIFPSLLILGFTRSLSKRLGLLFKGIRWVQNQRFDLLKTERANDEIGQLTEEFNKMTTRIDGLIHDVYIAELNRRQAQFNALQSQINPHYLYNTLDAVRMSCVTKGEEETAHMIKLLGRGFRRSLSWEQDMIPLQEELEFVMDYLEIQQFRYGQRLLHNLEVDERVLDIPIPKMSILPLVENACIHGIEHLECQGTITVLAVQSGTEAHIQVQDNGIGIEPNRLVQLLGSLESSRSMESYADGKHVGLKNVHARLKWHFADDFKLSITSDHSMGTTVEIKIPVSLQSSDDDIEGGIHAC